jgi:hypothetical protein
MKVQSAVLAMAIAFAVISAACSPLALGGHRRKRGSRNGAGRPPTPPCAATWPEPDRDVVVSGGEWQLERHGVRAGLHVRGGHGSLQVTGT